MNIAQKKKYLHQKRKCLHPNLLIKKWLTEWKKDAHEKNSNMQYNYSRALKSLELYPLPLYSGTDCKILCHFGEKLCNLIDSKLQRHIEQNGPINWENFIKIDKQKKKRIRNSLNKKDLKKSEGIPTTTQLKRKGTYIPMLRSGAYALLLTLADAVETSNYKGFMMKDELINVAQEFSDASFTIAPNGSRYTAWASMSNLIKKGLIFKCGSPTRYSITEDGVNLVKQINCKDGHENNKACKHLPTLSSQNIHSLSDKDKEEITVIHDLSDDEQFHNAPKRKCTHLQQEKTRLSPPIAIEKPYIISSALMENETDFVYSNYQFYPDTFKIILCVDSAETAGGFKSGKKNMKDAILTELMRQKVNFDVRKLHIGDFLWIAQEISSDKKKRELVLPFIVERKRLDDLASSIVDGRFREQKYRLKQCGLSRPIYLVEEYGSRNTSLPLSTCEQAIANTQIVDGFQVKLTTNINESINYLNNMTKYMQRKYQSKILRCVQRESVTNDITSLASGPFDLMDFDILNASSMKNKQLCVKDMFAKHLLQLCGLSIDKAAPIVQKYPTPRLLIRALNNCCTDKDREAELSTLKCPRSGRMIGPRISSSIVQLYTSTHLS